MGRTRLIFTVSAFAVAALATPLRAETLVVNSYGGPYEAIIRKAIIEPFAQRTGIDVIYDPVGSASQDYAKIKATGGRPGFDVVVMTASQSLQGCKDGVLEKLDANSIPNLAKLSRRLTETAGPCGAVHEVQYMSLLYRTDKLATPPVSWSALASSDLQGRVVMPTFQNTMAIYLVEMFSLMNGGDLVDNLAPGFKAVAAIAKRSIGFEQSSAILESYIKDGTVWAMPFWSGRAQLLVDSGLSVDYVKPKEGTIPLVATLNIPIGAEHKDAARKFIDFFLEKTSQEAWVGGYKVGSARTDIDVPAAVKARQITSDADLNSLHLPNLTTVAERLPKWAEQWERDVVAHAN